MSQTSPLGSGLFPGDWAGASRPPARVRPPYQTVIFFASARALDIPSSENLTDMKFIDFVIQSGRAVVYPVYKGTYDRPAPMPSPDTVTGRES